jgi:hypothetical protein
MEIAMLKQSCNHKVNRKPASMLRVIWCNEEAGEIVKHYNAKTLADCKMMRGFHVKSWSIVPPVAYSK